MRKIKTKAELKAVGPGEAEDAMAPLTCGLCYKVTCSLLCKQKTQKISIYKFILFAGLQH